MKTTFLRSLKKAWSHRDSLLCVGLDPDRAKLPPHLQEKDDAVITFCKGIVDMTHDLVCAYKPQIAYFADEAGEEQLEEIIGYIKATYPHIPVILDAKRGDIGSTAARYAREAFERFKADAVTINPYMGRDSAEPFLEREDKGVIVLCKTSNPGGAEFQDLEVNGRPLYEQVAINVAEHWNTHKNCALVVGATWPEQMQSIRSLVGDLPFLVPGIGAQGGDVEATIKAGRDSNGAGLMVNSARGIIFAGNDEEFALTARSAATALRNEINRYR